MRLVASGRRSSGEFVGRRRELAELREVFRDALDGAGALILVAGEPGIGKTRLAAEFSRDVQNADVPVRWGRVSPDEAAPPYWPWPEVLAPGVGSTDLMASIATARGGPLEQWQRADRWTRFELFTAVSGVLRMLSESQGLVIVLDDLQWADEASLLLLRHIAEELTDSRTLVVGLYRDVEVVGDHPLGRILPDLGHGPNGRRLFLRGLETDEVRLMMDVASGTPVPMSLVGTVHDRTGGNPFYLREFIRLLTEEGFFTGGRESEFPTLGVPAGVREIVLRRTERLGDDCLRLLRVAALAGRRIDSAMLEHACELERHGVLSAVDRAVAARLLAVDRASHSTVDFAHDLIREALDATVSVAEGVDIHHRIAVAIESVHAGDLDDHLAELAQHWLAGATTTDDRRRAREYAQRAGNRAIEQLAYEEGARWYRSALTADVRAAAERASLLLEIARAEYLSGHIPDSLTECEAAADEARRASRPDLIGEAALICRGVNDLSSNARRLALCEEALDGIEDADSALRSRLIAERALSGQYVLSAEENDRLSRQAIEMAERVGDPFAMADALRSRQLTRSGPDGVHDRLEAAERLLAASRHTGRQEDALWARLWRVDAFFELADLNAVDAELAIIEAQVERTHLELFRWHLARTLACRADIAGRFADSERWAREARAIGDRLGVDFAEGTFQGQMAHLAWQLGRFLEPEASYRPHVEATRHRPVVRGTLACALLEQGRMAEAEAEYRIIQAAGRKPARDWTWLQGSAQRAQLACAFDPREAAASLLDELRPFAGRLTVIGAGQVACLGPVDTFLGMLALRLERWGEADRHLTDASAICRRIASPPLEARALHLHAMALHGRAGPGDAERALRLVDQAAGTARRLDMQQLLRRLEALRSAWASAAGPHLTGRELEVAALVSQGMTNKQIASRLHLSERTAESHIEHILNKLGFTSRAQVAVWAATNDVRTPQS